MANKMTLEFEVKKQSIFRKDIFKPTENSKNYLFAHFNFGEDWQGLDKKVAIFSYNKKDYMVDIDGETDTCEIIEDVTKSSGFKLGVKGYLNNKQVIITSDPIFVSVKSTYDIADDILEPIRQLLSSTLDIKKFQYTGSIEIPNIYATKLIYNEDKTKLLLCGRVKDNGEDLILNEIELNEVGLEKVESGYYDNENKKMVFTLKEENNNVENEISKQSEEIPTPPSDNVVEGEVPTKKTIEMPFEFNIDGNSFEVDLSNYYTKKEVDDKLLEKINKIDFQTYKEETKTTLDSLLSIDSFDKFKDQNGIDLNNKVDKQEGKGLSSNDYTNEDKEKVDKLVFDIDGKISSDILPPVEIDEEQLKALVKDGVGVSNVEVLGYEQDTETNSTITNIAFNLTDGSQTNTISIKAKNGVDGKDGANGIDGQNAEQQTNAFDDNNYYTKSDIDTKITNINNEISTINQDIENITMALSQMSEQGSSNGGVSGVSLLSDEVEENNANTNNDSISGSDYSNEISLINNKLIEIESKVEEIKSKQNEASIEFNKSGIVEIFSNFQKLSSYNKKNELVEGDLVQVLIDEKYNNASTIYKWNGSYFSYIGKFGNTYSKNELDVMFNNIGNDISSISQTISELSAKVENQNTIHTHYLNIFFNKDIHTTDFEELQLSLDIVSNKKETYSREELFSYLENASDNIVKASGFYKANDVFSIVLFICETNIKNGTMIIESATMSGTKTLTFNLSELDIFDNVL